ncbi:Cullin-associated NEDD8-dissociated protein 1 [Orobanche minor]
MSEQAVLQSNGCRSRSPRDGKHLEVLGYTIPSWEELQRRNLELDSFRAKIEENQKKIKLNKQLPYLVGNVVEAFVVIDASQLQLNISCVLEHLIAGITTFLRKAIQALIMATLEMLNALIAANGDKLGSAAYGVIIEELSTVMKILTHVAALALNLCSTMLADRNSTTKVGLTVRRKVFPQVITLVRSSCSKNKFSWYALQSFFVVLIPFADTSFDNLLGLLISIDILSFKYGEMFIHSKTASSHVDSRYHYIVRLVKNSIQISIQKLGEMNPNSKYLEVEELCASTTTGDESEDSDQEDDDRDDDE